MKTLPELLRTDGAGVASVRISRRWPPAVRPGCRIAGSQVTFQPDDSLRAVPSLLASNSRSLPQVHLVVTSKVAVPSLYSTGLSTSTSICCADIARSVVVRVSPA